MKMQDTVMNQPRDKKLTPIELAEALYEGTPHLSNLAETLARQHGQKCEALSFFALMSDREQIFWLDIANQIIEHSRHWGKGPTWIENLTKEAK